jgi:hypothetical protein
MLKIKKGEPWLFWPSNVCDSFPESPGNKFLVGDTDFTLTLKVELFELDDVEKTIFTIVPNYTGISVFKNRFTFTITTENGPDYHSLNHKFSAGKVYIFKYVNKPKQGTSIYINNILMISLDKNILHHEEPHIILGAGNFPKNGFNLNYCEMNVSEFKLESKGEIISHHDFKTFIHDKSYDISGNCNFLNKI